MPPTSDPLYVERLGVPFRWWVQGFMFTASLWLAVVVALPEALAWSLTGLTAAIIALGFLAYGSASIVVGAGEFRAGRAHIDARFLGEATALDAEQTRRTAGVDADVRAYLLLRPYLKRAVRVEITDPADPAPYWLVSTRQPERLAQALTALTAPR